MVFNFVLKGNISVHSMKTLSGIFIGEQNTSMGWSAHGKTNSVFNSISGYSNRFVNNLSLVNDPDLIDSPIDDRDIHINEENLRDSNANILLSDLHVNTMMQNSSVFLGRSTLSGSDANEKDNYAVGSTYGNLNKSYHNLNINLDRDIIDGIINDQDIKIANVIKRE